MRSAALPRFSSKIPGSILYVILSENSYYETLDVADFRDGSEAVAASADY